MGVAVLLKSAFGDSAPGEMAKDWHKRAYGRSHIYDDDDENLRASSSDSSTFGYGFNIDGSPMMGSVDIHGNPYGFTKTDDSFSSWLMDSGPMVNIDGSPMMGDIDIHGNPFGVTDDHSFGGFSSDDSFGSTNSFDSFGSDDSFGSSYSSGSSFDD